MVQGNQGGIELGFNYRTRLTGLDGDEAEALAVAISALPPELSELGMNEAAGRAVRKLIESFPDTVRHRMCASFRQFRFEPGKTNPADERLVAMVAAIHGRKIVQIRAHTMESATIYPSALVKRGGAWSVVSNGEEAGAIPLSECGNINISAKTF